MALEVTLQDEDYELNLTWPNEDEFEIASVRIKRDGRWVDLPEWEIIRDALFLLASDHEDLPRDYAEYIAGAAEWAREQEEDR